MTSENNVVELYKSGLSTHKVAKETNISQSQVRRILKKHNVASRPTRMDPVLEKEIFNKYNAGESSEKIAKNYNINGTTVCRIIKRLGGKIRPAQENKRKLDLRTDWFSNIDSEAKAYFLGLLYVGANINPAKSSFMLRLQTKDGHIIHTLANLLYPTENTKDRIKQDSYYQYICVSSIDMIKDLTKHGASARNTNLNYPTHIKSDLMRHFIRGYFDDHGHIGKEISIPGPLNFLEKMCTIIKSHLDTDIQINEKIVISNIDEFLNWIYGNSTYYLNKNYNLYLNNKSQSP